MDSVNDVPPLEDMSEVLESFKAFNLHKNGHINESSNIDNSKSDNGSNITTKFTESVNKKSKPQKEFGFMNGFLLSSNQEKKSKQKKEKIDYVVKATETSNNSLVFEEVKSEMNNYNMLNDNKWVTDELLSKVESNKKLFDQLSKPKFSQAIEMMKSNPEKALEFYKYDTEVQEFFKSFYKLLGNHFTQLSDKDKKMKNSVEDNFLSEVKPKPSDNFKDNAEVEKIVSDPDIRRILMKPQIQRLITLLKENPNEAMKVLNSGDSNIKSDINKLVSVGVLAFK